VAWGVLISDLEMLRASIVLASLLALPAIAHAGSYVSAGIGTAPSIGGDASATFNGDGH